MNEETMVTTYTVTSSTFRYCGPTNVDPQDGGTWAITTKVRETLSSALDHVHAMGESEYPHTPVVGGTVRRPSFRYTWESATGNGTRAHDMVIIVPDQDRDHTGLTQWEINETSLPG